MMPHQPEPTPTIIGMQGNTGRSLSGVAHLRQSITDILSTPLGSRVMRSDYGSGLFSLIDAPMGSHTNMAVYAAIADALDKWEPRITLHRVQHHINAQGRMVVSLWGEYRPEGRSLTLAGLVL